MQKVGCVLTVEFGKRAYSSRPASLAELTDIRKFIVSIVGDVTPIDEMVELSRHNPDWLNGVRGVGKQGFAGAFAILPLKEEAALRFAKNAMRGADITMEHIVSNTKDASAIYVGSIVSDSSIFNRAATLSLFEQKMQEFALQAQKQLPLFTRPVSEDGLRTTTGMGYKPVIDRPHALGDMIYGKNL